MSRKTPEIAPKADDKIVLGECNFLKKSKQLQNVEGEIIPLRSQSLEVLAILAESPGEIVSKDTLIDRVWGETFVTDDSLVQCISDIRRVLGPKGRDIVRTFPKRGYQLFVPEIPAPGKGKAHVSSAVAQRTTWRAWIMPAMVSTFLVVAALLYGVGPNQISRVPGDGKARVAVLPFDDFSKGEDDGYLSDAIAEGVITELARSPYFSVIARNSSFRYRDTSPDVREIARELNVDYIVEGSQQKKGEKLRVTAQLIDAHDGSHVWAHTYDLKIGDLFVVQDQIVRTLANRLGIQIEREQPKRDAAAVSAMHHRLVGLAAIRSDFSAENSKLMRLEGEKAIAIAPDAHHGYLLIGHYYRHAAVFGFGDIPHEKALAEAERYADKAILLAPEDHRTHYLRARLHSERAEFDQANALFAKAASLNPSDGDVLVASAEPLLLIGKFDEAIARINQAKGIDPFHRDWYHWQMGWALWEKDDCEGALNAMQKMSPIKKGANRMLAGIHACLGNVDEARAALAIFMEDSKPTTLTKEREKLKDLWIAPGSLDRWIEHMRIAGMPE